MTRKISAIELNGMFFNTPLMVSDSYFSAVLTSIQARTVAQMVEANEDDSDKMEIMGNVAVIPVFGCLSHHKDSGMGGSTYDGIRENKNAALENPLVTKILYDVRSPGGVCAGLFDLTDEIYESRSQKPSFAFVNETANSAAYAIAAATNQVVIPRTGEVGSIGVKAIFADVSKLNQSMGIKFEAIYAGDRKMDFDPKFPLSKEARAIGQADVDSTADLFINTMAKYRRGQISGQAIRGTQAATYRGRDAVKMGLADVVMAYSEAKKLIMGE
ncbi:MAG: S49 family peptidase [Smithella sp.]